MNRDAKHLLQALLLTLSLGHAAAHASSAPTLAPADLLAAVYPASEVGAESLHLDEVPVRLAPVALSDMQWPWMDSEQVTSVVEIVPMTVVRLDRRHAVMVTRVRPLVDDNRPMCGSYGCQYAIGAYFFTGDDRNGWTLSEAVEMAGEAASNSDLQPVVRTWPGHGKILSIPLSFYGQDVSRDETLLMGLEADRVSFFDILPRGGYRVGSGDLGCSRFLDTRREPRRQNGYDHNFDCWREQGRWRMDGNAIRYHYVKFQRKAGPKGRLLPLARTVHDVTLVPRNGALKAISGTLPDVND